MSTFRDWAGRRGRQLEGMWQGRKGRAAAWILVLFGAACLCIPALLYQEHTDVSSGDLVELEILGASSGAEQTDICLPPLSEGEPPRSCRSAEEYEDAVRAEWLLVVGYGMAFGVWSALGLWLFRSPRGRRVALLGLIATASAVIANVVENCLLLAALRDSGGAGRSSLWEAASVAAAVKFVLLMPAAVVAGTSVLVTAFRATWPAPDYKWLKDPAPEYKWLKDKVRAPAPVITGSGEAWPRPAEPDRQSGPSPNWAPPGREPAKVGLCVSGGGIRSATVTLGVLQELRAGGVLKKARYLVSVSGGGYMAGAWQLATRPLPNRAEGKACNDPGEIFWPTSPEEDHLRRHSKYVAESFKEWLVALGVLLRGVLASTFLLAATVTVAGIALGLFYRHVPLAFLDYRLPSNAGGPQPWRAPVAAVTTSIVLLLGLAFVAWLVRITIKSIRGHSTRWLASAAAGLVAVGVLVAVVGLLIPALVWGLTRLAWALLGDRLSSGQAAAGAGGTVTVVYLSALVSILWRQRRKIGGVRRWFGTSSSVQARVPSGIVQYLIVWAALAVLVGVFAMLLGAVVRTASMPGSIEAIWSGFPDSTPWQWWFVLAPALLLFMSGLVDQTWMSLHPYYRRRLATAFAVRRYRQTTAAEGTSWLAKPYDFDKESTKLSQYGARPDGMPQVIFAGAAQLSGPDRSPPGRRAVSFTLSSDWVGGAQVGWAQTEALENNTSKHLNSDLTVQSAMAVSAAAFASAMGSQARAFQTLLAISNARLGTWLPNPGWLSERPLTPSWTQPRLPRVRRVTYLLREVLGIFDQQDRLLLVTDGGHYDNLGLVELLRHRCRVVFCIDSSGDTPPVTGALADAITLAHEELGIEIRLNDQFALVPGSASPLDPVDPLTTLSARLSRQVVITGQVIYPEPFAYDGEEHESKLGRIVIAKTRLTPNMPYEILVHAARSPVFPYDSTSDQWFDHEQFNAYHALGRYLGIQAVKAGKPLIPG